MELPCVSPNQNKIPLLELREILIPKEEASKVSLRGHAHALSASQRVGLVVAANAGSHDPVHVL
jgi:predicted phosphodiesterase